MPHARSLDVSISSTRYYMQLCKLLLAAIGATAVFAVLTATATARSLSSTSQFVRAQFRELDFEGAFGHTMCQVTIEGSLHSRTIAKVRDSLLGYVTAAGIGPCSVGKATMLTETLPWHITYITSGRFRVIGASHRVITPIGENCLARSTAEAPVIVVTNIGAGGVVNSANIEGSGIPTSCFFSGRDRSDSGVITVLNSFTRITIRLI
jgi:hypothetical protein